MLVGDGDIVQGDPSNTFGGGTEIADRALLG